MVALTYLLFGVQQHALIPQVRTEKRDGSTTNNPYVAFRRRTEKMQTRKVCVLTNEIHLMLTLPSLSDDREPQFVYLPVLYVYTMKRTLIDLRLPAWQ